MSEPGSSAMLLRKGPRRSNSNLPIEGFTGTLSCQETESLQLLERPRTNHARAVFNYHAFVGPALQSNGNFEYEK